MPCWRFVCPILCENLFILYVRRSKDFCPVRPLILRHLFRFCSACKYRVGFVEVAPIFGFPLRNPSLLELLSSQTQASLPRMGALQRWKIPVFLVLGRRERDCVCVCVCARGRGFLTVPVSRWAEMSSTIAFLEGAAAIDIESLAGPKPPLKQGRGYQEELV